jgi:hypothetical protein
VFPGLVRVRQLFQDNSIPDVSLKVAEELSRVDIGGRIMPGQAVAITAGSRGIDRIAEVLSAIVAEVKKTGGQPFIFPAMGSHGGATAEGQVEVLEKLGITETSVGAPVKSTMEVVRVGSTRSGLPVYCDKSAYSADAIIAVNRIKPHTILQGEIQSGLLKILAVGLGKKVQAGLVHSYGVEGLHRHIPEVAGVMLEKTPVVLGIGLVENSLDKLAVIEAIPPERLEEREAELLRLSGLMMARLPFGHIDILIVDEMGKNISGTGMDPNVIGRRKLPGIPDQGPPVIKVILVRDLTGASCGNAIGVGLADLITRRLYEKIDLHVTATNVVTTTFLERGKIPVTLPSDREAVEAAFTACGAVPREEIRLVRIRNTLHLSELLVSRAMLPEAEKNTNLVVTGHCREFEFDAEGNLTGGWE